MRKGLHQAVTEVMAAWGQPFLLSKMARALSHYLVRETRAVIRKGAGVSVISFIHLSHIKRDCSCNPRWLYLA